MILGSLEHPVAQRPGDAHSTEQALYDAAMKNQVRRLSNLTEIKDCEMAVLKETVAEVKSQLDKALAEVANSHLEDGDNAETVPSGRA